jgi:hypothetical protein
MSAISDDWFMLSLVLIRYPLNNATQVLRHGLRGGAHDARAAVSFS